VYAGKLTGQDVITIEKETVPSGVIQILLLDDEMNPLSERQVFCLNENELPKADFSTDKPAYTTREHVSAQVMFTDEAGNPLDGTFSVAVTDDGDVQPDSLFSIVSNLLLCSDIRGYVESPEYYVQNPDRADILMLTQGWKRYDIPAVLKGNIEKPVHFLEAGQEISGKVERMLGSKANADNTVSLVVGDGYVNTVQTDKDGRFTFNGFEYPDSTVFIVQAQAKSKLGKDYVELVMDRETFPETKPFPVPEYKPDSLLEKYIEKFNLKYMSEYEEDAILLDAITIEEKRPRPKSKYSSIFSTVIYPEDFKRIKGFDLTRALKLFPYLPVFGGKILNGFSIIIDDWPLHDADLRDIDIDINEIESIEVVEDVLFSTFPVRKIIITTKSKTYGKGRKIKFNIKSWRPKGYREAAEFYSPKYKTDEELRKGADRRTTIFWKPNVAFKNGNAQFDFYTADANNTYSVVIEGITDNGRIVRKTGKIFLKKEDDK
jgi:hypothetical protein